MAALVWFRHDLRVRDNPALLDACEQHPDAVTAMFLIAESQWRSHHLGDTRLGYLRETLQILTEDLATLNIPMVIETAPRFTDAPAVLIRIARATAANTVFCNAEYPLDEQRRDDAVAAACAADGIRFIKHHGDVVLPPGSVLTEAGAPYTVFTPFKRRWLATLTPDDYTPLPAPSPMARHPVSNRVSNNQVLTALPPPAFDPDWPAGETAAYARLDAFLEEHAARYHLDRDFPLRAATSRLSAPLSVGSISVRACLAVARDQRERQSDPDARAGFDAWISELIWRDFYRHVIAQFPHVSQGAAFRRDLDRLKWRRDPQQLHAWKTGRTGYPLVDAAMRQLARTGFMHNRLRMVSAMFLSKHLLIDWREGERHFLEHLRDADFASNNGGWQWSASTGTDAAPYFRIFNPASQAKKFDPDGAFIHQFVPELAGAGNDLFSSVAPDDPSNYPPPIVDHAFARARALDFFKG